MVLGAKRAMGGLPFGQASGAACVSRQAPRDGAKRAMQHKAHRRRRCVLRGGGCGGRKSCVDGDTSIPPRLFWVGFFGLLSNHVSSDVVAVDGVYAATPKRIFSSCVRIKNVAKSLGSTQESRRHARERGQTIGRMGDLAEVAS